MKSDLFKLALDVVSNRETTSRRFADAAKKPSRPSIKKIGSRALSYTEKHRGQWFKPEYDLEEIQIAQDTDSFLFRAIKKKTNRFSIAGWEIIGQDPATVDYVKQRLSEMEQVSGKPFKMLLTETAHDIIRYSNCMWVKVRNQKASTGKPRTNLNGKELEPVAGYFILPMETLSFKTKTNGEIKKVKQKTPSGESKEFAPDDLIHFYDNKKPGFAIGTPEMLPVLDDIALLRRLEENIEELIESNLYPLFHYSVGTDEFPERYGPDGEKETDIVKQTIEYMPAGGIYVSDHRHSIQAIGSEGRALRCETYLDYFKKRVFAGLGVSSVDMGEGDTANRATANTLSKSAIQDVEALQRVLKVFIEHFVFAEILSEGGYGFDHIDKENKVEIKFGIIDKEERTKLENQIIQLWLNKLVSEQEARKLLGLDGDIDREDSYFTLYEEPLAMMKAMGMIAADESLAGSATSSVTPESVKRQQEQAQQQAAAQGRPPNSASTGSQRASAEASRPSNQHGTRSSPKFDKNILDSWRSSGIKNIKEFYLDGLRSIVDKEDSETLESNSRILIEAYSCALAGLSKTFKDRIEDVSFSNVSEKTLLKSFDWKVQKLDKAYSCKAYNYGVIVGSKSQGVDISVTNLLEADEIFVKKVNSIIDLLNVNVINIPPNY